MLCISGVLALAIHSRSRFFSAGTFERSNCLTGTKHVRVGESYQTGMYKHPRDNGLESICCKGLEVPQSASE